MAAAAFVTDLTEIFTQAAEAAAGIGSILQNYELLKISENYYKLYERQRQFYYDTFQVGVEAPLAAEIYTDPIPVLNYTGQVGEAYNAVTGPFGGASTDTLGWWTRHAQAYNTAISPQLQLELTTDIARIKSDWTNYLFRFEEVRFDQTTDIRWRKRLAVHNIGIKIGADVSSAMEGALTHYQEHIAESAGQLATYGNGIAKWVGYQRGLSDVSEAYNAMSYDVNVIRPQAGIRPGERPYVNDRYPGAQIG